MLVRSACRSPLPCHSARFRIRTQETVRWCTLEGQMQRTPDGGEFEQWYLEHYRRLVASLYLVTGERSRRPTRSTKRAPGRSNAGRGCGAWSPPRGWTMIVARNALRATARADTTARRGPSGGPLSVNGCRRPRCRSRCGRGATATAPWPERSSLLRYLGGLQEHEIAERWASLRQRSRALCTTPATHSPNRCETHRPWRTVMVDLETLFQPVLDDSPEPRPFATIRTRA